MAAGHRRGVGHRLPDEPHRERVVRCGRDEESDGAVGQRCCQEQVSLLVPVSLVVFFGDARMSKVFVLVSL